MDEVLFPTDDLVVEFKRFDKVNVRCAWGDEIGHIVSVSHCDSGHPVINVELTRFPARVSVSPGNVRHLEES